MSNWQELPYGVETINGVTQGASDTYWVNQEGAIVFIVHPSVFDERGDADFKKRGPWMQIKPSSMNKILKKSRDEVAQARLREEQALQALSQWQAELQTFVDRWTS